MGSIKIGSSGCKFFLGTSEVSKIYVGETAVYQTGHFEISYTRQDSICSRFNLFQTSGNTFRPYIHDEGNGVYYYGDNWIPFDGKNFGNITSTVTYKDSNGNTQTWKVWSDGTGQLWWADSYKSTYTCDSSECSGKFYFNSTTNQFEGCCWVDTSGDGNYMGLSNRNNENPYRIWWTSYCTDVYIDWVI